MSDALRERGRDRGPTRPVDPAGRRRAVVLATALALLVADLAVVLVGVPGSRGGTTSHRLQLSTPVTAATPGRHPATTVRTTTRKGNASRGNSSTTGPAGRADATNPAQNTAVVPQTSPQHCPAGACVTIDATSTMVPVDHAGGGLNLLPSTDTDGSQVRALGATMYRSAPGTTSAGTFEWGSWDAAVAGGAQTTLILSDLWAAHFHGPPATPWSDWTAYTSWVHTTVQQIVASGHRVDYWDVYNEPGWVGYYRQSDFDSMTADDLLQQFLVTYQQIKAVDPGAAIIGPSTGKFVLAPLPPDYQLTREPDLTTFLNFASAHNLQLAAVAWHDNHEAPATLYNQAQIVWGLIHARPALGHPQMFLDEYGSTLTQPIPGWDVGFLSMIADAGITSAVRSCWDSCTLSTLDGLLIDNGQEATTEYYERRIYARMSGTTVRVSSSDASVPGVASISSSGTEVDALIGRMAGCGTASWCQNAWHSSSGPPPPTSVQVSLVLPWTTRNISIGLSYEPFQPGQASSGPVNTSPVNPTLAPDGSGREVVTFTIPGFADGSAYNVIVSRT